MYKGLADPAADLVVANLKASLAEKERVLREKEDQIIALQKQAAAQAAADAHLDALLINQVALHEKDEIIDRLSQKFTAVVCENYGLIDANAALAAENCRIRRCVR